jgi:hypothetical protein
MEREDFERIDNDEKKDEDKLVICLATHRITAG